MQPARRPRQAQTIGPASERDAWRFNKFINIATLKAERHHHINAVAEAPEVALIQSGTADAVAPTRTNVPMSSQFLGFRLGGEEYDIGILSPLLASTALSSVRTPPKTC